MAKQLNSFIRCGCFVLGYFLFFVFLRVGWKYIFIFYGFKKPINLMVKYLFSFLFSLLYCNHFKKRMYVSW